MSDFFDTVLQAGKEIIETVKSKMKLSTAFDLFTEKAIPATVSEDKLEEYYEKRMKDLYRVIYDM
ncbi:MAG: hypothetical protein RBG13Loki_2965 [Promethearchaeota archaeon CR_4]|nr:MAG: hypothetical protein RBG13Loki_2965 [Candidatus Lokiarchaeota archaeon CR_4]